MNPNHRRLLTSLLVVGVACASSRLTIKFLSMAITANLSDRDNEKLIHLLRKANSNLRSA